MPGPSGQVRDGYTEFEVIGLKLVVEAVRVQVFSEGEESDKG